MPLERSRSNDSRHDDEYSIRDEYCDDLRDNNDDYSTIADYSTVTEEEKPGDFGFSTKFFPFPTIADYSTVTEEEKPGDFGFSTKFFPFPTIADYSTVTEEEKPDDFGFSTKFFCCDSTMSWGFRLGKEDEDAESEKNVKRGIIPHFPQRGRSLARTDPFPRGRGKSLSRTDERQGRSHSRSRSFYGAKSTSSAKKFKGLFSNLSRKKASTGNKEIAPSIPPTNVCDASDSSSLAKAEIERLKSQLTDLKKAEEERRRQAELLEAATNATNEGEKRTFAEAAALAAEAATKALDDEETKRAAGALLAHQMEEDHEASLDQNKQEDEDVEDEEEGRKISPDTTISKDSTKVETNVKKETAENNTSNVSTENGSEGTDSEHNEYQVKKASELKEKKRNEEAAREKKALELKEKKRKEEAAREKKASELKEKKAAQKVRREYPHLFLVSAFCRSRYFVSRPNTIHSTAFLSFLLPKGAQTDGRQGEEGQEAFKERAEEESSKAGSD